MLKPKYYGNAYEVHRNYQLAMPARLAKYEKKPVDWDAESAMSGQVSLLAKNSASATMPQNSAHHIEARVNDWNGRNCRQ